MENYIGKKWIEAEPMNEYVAVEKRLAHENTDHHEQREGYHVKYKDGYESWSPKGVFEESYKISNTPLDRILIEGEDLTIKLEKLKNFTVSDKFFKLDKPTKALLLTQIGIMQNYQFILNLRYSGMESGNSSIDHMPFNIALILLSVGFAIRRSGWDKDLYIIKQVPYYVKSDFIQNGKCLNTALPYVVGQCLGCDGTGQVRSWIPSNNDLFACDWELYINDNIVSCKDTGEPTQSPSNKS